MVGLAFYLPIFGLIGSASARAVTSRDLNLEHPNARATQTNRAQVIILGGGIAGISVARTLANDYNITDIILIEGRDELGGRAHTETLTGADGTVTTVEKGCNWIQGPLRESIQELADKYGLKTAAQNYSDIIFYEGKAGIEGPEATGLRGSFLTDDETLAFTEGYDNFLDNAPGYSTWRQDNMLVDLTVKVATSIMDWIPVNPMQKLYQYWNIDYTFAQPPDVCSFVNAFGQEAGIADQEDQFVTDRRGYKYIFVEEAKTVFGQDLDDPRLHLSTVVRTIDYSGISNGSDILVSTDKGDFYASGHVISTLSVGVLQNQDVIWQPKLPDWKKEAIFTFGMATYQKIFLLFSEQFWGANQYVLYGDPDVTGRYAVWQNINAPGFFPQNTSANIFMVTATDALARRNEELTDEDIQGEVMNVLREMYGEDIPDPDDILIPRWTLDPLYRGSYSNWPIGALDQHHENLRKPVGSGRVHFTGEAMSEEAFGYVQGAWLEGNATAVTVANCISGVRCPEVEVYEALTTCDQAETALTRRGGKTRRYQGPARRHGSPKARRRS